VYSRYAKGCYTAHASAVYEEPLACRTSFPRATRWQAVDETLDELNGTLREVIELLSVEGQVKLEAELVGTQQVTVG